MYTYTYIYIYIVLPGAVRAEIGQSARLTLRASAEGPLSPAVVGDYCVIITISSSSSNNY